MMLSQWMGDNHGMQATDQALGLRERKKIAQQPPELSPIQAFRRAYETVMAGMSEKEREFEDTRLVYRTLDFVAAGMPLT